MFASGKTRNILIVSIFIFVVAAGVFLGALYYLNKTSEEVSLLEGEVVYERNIAKAAETLKRSFSENAVNINLIDSFFVLPNEEAEFIKQIEQIALGSKTKLEINTFSHAFLQSNDKFEYAIIQANARGSLQNVYHLLTVLESFPKAIEISRVDLEYITGDPKKPREWRLAFAIRALKLK